MVFTNTCLQSLGLLDRPDKNCQEEITDAFKKAGMYNDRHGRENHLIRVTMMPEYVAPKKDDTLPEVPKKKKKSRKSRRGKKRKAAVKKGKKKRRKTQSKKKSK